MMKFITEEYLRDLFRKEPFDTYKLNEGQRLTPGARQYLSDKRIELQDDVFQVIKKASKEDFEKNKKDFQVEEAKVLPLENSRAVKKLCCRLQTVEAMFLVTSSEVLNLDIILAQNIMGLGRKISNIRYVVQGKAKLEGIPFKPCTGIDLTSCREELEDCFEINEFHLQLQKSKEILKLHSLRCGVRELLYDVEEAYKGKNEDLLNKILENVNSIINSLSQMVCITVGGVKCQREP